VKGSCTYRARRSGILLMLCFLAMHAGSVVQAQWTFLGNQWIAADGVASEAIAINDRHQVHVATVEQGAAIVQRYDGLDWVAVGTGLPSTGQANCALAFDEDRPWIALGPALSLYTLDNGLWHPVAGLPAASAACNLQLRIDHDDVHWLAWTVQGAFDSAFVASDRGGSNWFVEKAFAGRLVDFELNENRDPVVLLDGASSLRIRVNGSWGTLPPFSQPQARYVGLAMSQDGTGTGAMVLRRDAAQALSVDLLSNGSWSQLGASGFAIGDQVDLQVDLAGVLHLLSVDLAAQAPPQAWHYIAGNWQLLGGQFVYNNTVSLPQLAFDGGAAFALFRDEEQAQRPSVMYLGTPLGNASHAVPGEIAIFPNPAAEVVYLRAGGAPAGATVQLYDAQGRVHAQVRVQAGVDTALSLAQLPAGRYWLILQRGAAWPIIGSFTKN
jgi:hypothetical protein